MSDSMLVEAVTEADWQRLCEEFDTTKQRVAEDVALLKQWLTQQPHLPQNILGDPLIQTMLIRCKMSLELTKEALDYFFTIKSHQSEIFSNRDPMSAEMQSTMDLFQIAVIPKLTEEGHRIHISAIRSEDATDFFFKRTMKMNAMFLELLMLKHEVLNIGEVLICDLKNLSMAHISKISLSQLKMGDDSIDKVYRVRQKAIHIVNAPPLVDILLTMAKCVLKSKMVTRIHFHTTMESLHQHVDPALLPEEYGGSYKTLTELAGNYRKELENNRDWFLEQEVLQRVDESKRPGGSLDTNALFGVVGTFRTLTVD